MRRVRKAVAPTNNVHIPQFTWLDGSTNFISGPARGVSTLTEPVVVDEPVLTDSSLGRIIIHSNNKQEEENVVGDDEAVLLSTAWKGEERVEKKSGEKRG